MIKEYRKKPVVVEAVQFLGNLDTIKKFIADDEVYDVVMFDEFGNPELITIYTFEGDHIVRIGDWIIRGIKGEYYPCKPDIFAMTYEEV